MEFVFEKIFVPQKHSFISRRFPLSSNAKVHSHKNYELNLVISGTGRRIVGDNISNFESGDLVLLGPELPHCWELLDADKDDEPATIVTHFYENLTSSDFFKLPELEKIVDLLNESHRGIRFKIKDITEIRSILESMVEQKGLDYYIGLLRIFKILLHTENREFLSNPIQFSDTFSKNLDKVNKVYEYVFQNIHEGINLEDASSTLNMAPSSFCRFFKKKTNMTFMEYVKSVRVGIAAKLLAETDKQITQICFECGYNNLANFNHYFKDKMGKTPTEYRKSFR